MKQEKKTEKTANQNLNSEGKASKPIKAKLIYWVYDDRRTIGSVLKGKNEYFHPTLLKNESEKNKEVSWLEQQEEDKKLKLSDKEIIKLRVGVDSFTEKVRDTFSGNHGISRQHFDEFAKLTASEDMNACKAIMQIVSIVLLSYCVRKIREIEYAVEDMIPECVRPLFAHVTSAANATYALHRLMEAVVVDTAVDEKKKIKLYSARVVPAPGTYGRKIADSTFLTIKDLSTYVWPMPYRDTAILFDRNYISPSDINTFLERNPWCAGIIYGKKMNVSTGLPVRVDGKAIAELDTSFNVDRIQKLVSAYVAEVPMFFERGEAWFTPLWRQAGTCLSNYSGVHPNQRMNMEARFKRRLQIFSVLSFFQFIEQRCAVPKTEMEQFAMKRLNALFPGCMIEELPVSIDDPFYASPEMLLEKALDEMLREENIGHFCFVPQKNGVTWPTKTNSGLSVWGYIKCYDWNQDGDAVPCLVLPRENLLRFVRTYMPSLEGFSEALGSFQKKRPEYMHSTLNARIKYPGEAKSTLYTAYRLRIDALPVPPIERHRLVVLAL